MSGIEWLTKALSEQGIELTDQTTTTISNLLSFAC